MTDADGPEDERAAPARNRWQVATPLLLMVTPVVHLSRGVDGGYSWFYLGLLLFFAAFLVVALLRPGWLDPGGS